MLEKIKDIRNKICDGNIKSALEKVKELCNHIDDRELKNRVFLACSIYNSSTQEETLGLGDKPVQKNNSILSILEMLDSVEDYFKESVSQNLVTNEERTLRPQELISLYEIISANTEKIEQLDSNEKQLLYMQALRLKKVMHDKIDQKLNKEYPLIIFNRLIFAEKLDKIEIDQLSTIPANKQFTWYEKGLIVSAISLSLIKRFDPAKIDLLINFIIPFDDLVWQRALLGLVLGLKNREDKIKLYPDTVRKLERLQEIQDVEIGLQIIGAELNKESYKGCFMWRWSRFMDKNSFKILGKVEQWFLPFYPNNPIIENVKQSFPNVKDIELIPELITNDRHLSNSQKYAIVLELPKWEECKVNDFIRSLKSGKNCTREHIFDPYIADFFWFFTFFPSDEFENLFKETSLSVKFYPDSTILLTGSILRYKSSESPNN